MTPSKQLACAVYRSLLRACNYGHHPEIFGKYAFQSGIVTLASSIPTNAKETRKSLRSAFETVHDIDMFTALRECNIFASIIRPKISNLPKSIPIFDFSSSSALIGEHLQFNFFEPRYLRLCQDALFLDDILRYN